MELCLFDHTLTGPLSFLKSGVNLLFYQALLVLKKLLIPIGFSSVTGGKKTHMQPSSPLA